MKLPRIQVEGVVTVITWDRGEGADHEFKFRTLEGMEWNLATSAALRDQLWGLCNKLCLLSGTFFDGTLFATAVSTLEVDLASP